MKRKRVSDRMRLNWIRDHCHEFRISWGLSRENFSHGSNVREVIDAARKALSGKR